MILLDAVRDFCRQHAKQHVWIALSGGLDSRVLLDACAQIKNQSSLVFHVIHIHHGLSPHADAWVQACEKYCREYEIDLHVVHVNLENIAGESLEEAARDARYQVFASLMQQDDLLLTAHHQNDQAETILLQLLRGSGPKGLSAMPAIKALASGFHGRPLLLFSRQELLDYAEMHHLEWVEDESNDNRTLTRNFIRHDVMPLLKNRWPNVESVMSRSAAHCAEAQTLLEETAREKLQTMQGSRAGTLSAAKLLTTSEAWQRLLLRTWIEQQGFALPDTSKLISIQRSVLNSAWDRVPCVEWSGVEVRRHRDDVYILSEARAENRESVYEWDLRSPLSLSATSTLNVSSVMGKGLKADIEHVLVRFRAHGDSVTIKNRGRLSLKNLFQEWQVPVWERSLVPLIFCGDQLVQAVGYFLDPAFAAAEGEAGIEIDIA